MQSSFRIFVLSAGLFFALPQGYAAGLAKPAAVKTGDAAMVNGTAISEHRVSKLVAQRVAKGQADSPELRREVIDQLSLQLLLFQAAVKNGLDKVPDVVDHMDLSNQSILAGAFVQYYLKKNPVSEEMLKSEYEKYQTKMAGTEYKARHILVETEAEARDIIGKLKTDSQLFESLAQEHSKDPGSKARGGDLGWFEPQRMVAEFSAAVVKLGKNKLAEEPVKSQFGYHVIMLDDSRPKAIPSFDQVKATLHQQLQQQQVKALYEEIKAKAKVDITQTGAPASPPSEKGKTTVTGK